MSAAQVMTPTVAAKPGELAVTPTLTYPRPDPLPADLVLSLITSWQTDRREARLFALLATNEEAARAIAEELLDENASFVENATERENILFAALYRWFREGCQGSIGACIEDASASWLETGAAR